MVERAGQQLGEYRLIQLLEESEAADVYLGEHISLKTLVVVKIFRNPLAEQDRPACLREVGALAGLAHPNIARVLDFGMQDETFFLIIEDVSGDTLRQSYPPGSSTSLASLVSLVKQSANALQYAHSQNIIHGDVRPENILLDSNNEVLLSNFEISTISQRRGLSQALPTAYKAPEQFDGKPQRASDQYALAVVAYELLTGELPFQDDVAPASRQNVHTRAISLSRTASGISPEIDEVLAVAMAMDAARRFSSIQAFARALEQACVGVLREAPSTLPEESSTWPAALAPALLPSPAYLMPDVATGNQIYTAPIQREIHPVDPHRVQPAPGQFQPDQLVRGTRTPRRVFLAASIAGGAIVIGGGLLALALSGKFPFPQSGKAAASTPAPGESATAQTASTSTEEPTPASTVSPGTTLATYTGQGSDVTGVCWSPVVSSRMVASCSLDGSAAIWNALTGGANLTFSQSGPLNTLAWSPDGQYIAAGGANKTVEVWDAAGGGPVSTCTGHTQPIFGLAWSPDSRSIVSTSQDNTAIVWDATTGNQLTTFAGHSNSVWVATWAPDGRAIATGSLDKTVQIWDPQTGSVILSYTSTQPVRAVDWSSDSSLIASGGDDNIVQIWQATSGNVLATYTGHSDHIEAVQWSPDGQNIASASKDTTVQIWLASSASQIYTYRGHSRLVWSLAWSPDGQLIASGSQDSTAQVWQAV